MCPRLSAVASKRGAGALYTVSLHVPAGRTLYTGGPGALTAVVLVQILFANELSLYAP